MTRKSGFKVHEGTTGGEFSRENVASYSLDRGDAIVVLFAVPPRGPGALLGYGGWFCADGAVKVTIEGGPVARTLTEFAYPDWNKFGSFWQAEDSFDTKVVVRFTATRKTTLAFWDLGCGVVRHKHLDGARDALLKNMYQCAPEVNFFHKAGAVAVGRGGTGALTVRESPNLDLVLKSCNRCARFLPINVNDERNHLSFPNHCDSVVRGLQLRQARPAAS